MGTPYLGEVKIVSFNFAPKGWAMCNGQSMPINQNQALFSILGTTYGGDGRNTFALPNLQGRVPVYVGQGITLGESSGEQAHTVTLAEMPAHTHIPNANSALADQGPAANNFWSGTGAYAAQPNGGMNSAGITPTGGSQPHENMTPYLTLNFIIALVGVFPSRN